MVPNFEEECQALGAACAAAKLRLDAKAPEAFQNAFVMFAGAKSFPSYFERKWLSLRLSAVKRGMVLDGQVDSAFLERITPEYCPVTLEHFSLDGKSPANPSVDRLVNEGTYAAGNIAMFSLRANKAKGARTFEAVAEIASSGEGCDGLEPLEWARMASLMYGAWSVSVRRQDPYLLPLATYPGAAMFTSQSQNVQLLLLRACRDDGWPSTLNVWLDATQQTGAPVDDFIRFAHELKAQVARQDYPPTAWLAPEVFEPFVDWYNKCHEAVTDLMQSFHEKYQAGINVQAIADRWSVGNRYLQ